jgi:hypothetical protein
MNPDLIAQLKQLEDGMDAARQTLFEARTKLKQAEAEQGMLAAARQAYLAASQAYQAFSPSELLLNKPLQRAAYSDRVAWIMAKLAKLAYINFENGDVELDGLKAHLDKGGFELVHPFSHREMQAILVRNKDFAVLAFRGTQPSVKEDVLTDLKAYKRPTRKSVQAEINQYTARITKSKSGKVHAGFEDGYNALAREILDVLTLKAPAGGNFSKDITEIPLYITGHSLGGALATVATARLEKVIGERMAACYTFGSPRVGNGNYKQDIKTPIYRMVHSTDIVTLVPSLGYTHAGDPRFISWSGNVVTGIPIWQRALEMLIALWPFNWARWVSSHDMSAYVAKLGAYADFRNRK